MKDTEAIAALKRVRLAIRARAKFWDHLMETYDDRAIEPAVIARRTQAEEDAESIDAEIRRLRQEQEKGKGEDKIRAVVEAAEGILGRFDDPDDFYCAEMRLRAALAACHGKDQP